MVQQKPEFSSFFTTRTIPYYPLPIIQLSRLKYEPKHITIITVKKITFPPDGVGPSGALAGCIIILIVIKKTEGKQLFGGDYNTTTTIQSESKKRKKEKLSFLFYYNWKISITPHPYEYYYILCYFQSFINNK